MRVKRLWVVLTVFVFSLIITGGLQAAVYLNDFPADITVNEGEPLIVPIFLEGTFLAGSPIELFVWVEDVRDPLTRGYLDATGWVPFTDIATMVPLGAATMVQYVNAQWRAFETTFGMSDFYINICMDGSVDGTLSGGADCAEPRRVVIVKGGVQPPPPTPTDCTLVVNPASLNESVDWYGTKKIQIPVNDSCNKALEFSATSSAEWMTLVRQTGLLEVTLNGHRTSGTYSGVITITAAGTTRQMPVTMTVKDLCIIGNCGGTTPPTTCTPTSMSVWPAPVGLSAAAGETPSTSVQVSDNCGNAVSYSASTASSWLSVTPSGFGTLTIGAVNTSALSPGTYTGTINISSGSLTRSIDVVLTITGVCEPTSAQIFPLSVAQTITAGTNANAAALTIQNNCQARIAYTVTAVDPIKDASSVPVSPAVIVTPAVNAAGTGDLSITFNSAHLAVGTYTGSITIAPAIGTPRTIPITITVVSADATIPEVTNMSVNYFSMSPNGIRTFKYMSMPVGQGQALQIGLANMVQTEGGNIDMIIKYAGPACESGVPVMADYNLVKDYIAANGNSRWTASSGTWSPLRARDDLYYQIGDASFEFNEIYGVPDNPQGCYFIMLVNTLTQFQSRTRLTIGDADCNVLGNCPASFEVFW